MIWFIIVSIVVLLVVYYSVSPKIDVEYIGLNGSIVKVESFTFSTITICYKIGSEFSSPLNVSRFYFKTNFIKWMK